MELDDDDYDYEDEDDNNSEHDYVTHNYFVDDNNNPPVTDTDFEDSQEFKQLKKSWKALKNSNDFDSTYWSHIVSAANEVRGIVRRLSVQDRLEKLATLLKIIESKLPICPDESLLNLQCLVKSFLPFINCFERSTQANFLNTINKIVSSLEQLKMKTVTHLLLLLKERDATILNLKKQVELLQANSTSESIGPSIASLNLPRFGELETLRGVSYVNEDIALLFKCNSCKTRPCKIFLLQHSIKTTS